MNTYLEELRRIKSVSMATVDQKGNPQVRIIDVMLIKDDVLYFCTARGKAFYRELMDTKKVSILAMNEKYQTIRLHGEVETLDHKKAWIDEIFLHNPVMENVYPRDTRYILEPFCIRNAQIEFFDLSTQPIYRTYDRIGNQTPARKGFYITSQCISCDICTGYCPQDCILEGNPFVIQQEHCLHCGNCFEHCPRKAIKQYR